MNMKAWQHFRTINHHKYLVMKNCFRVGLYKQGLLHDLSKYSPTEFLVGCRYYQGTRSPNNAEREATGYSQAWLHHKGRNKHHYEYWFDGTAPDKTPVIPYKYAVEMVCDTLAAGQTYLRDKWKNSSQLEYWNRTKDLTYINIKTANFLEAVYTEVSENGIDKTINKKNLERLYDKYCK